MPATSIPAIPSTPASSLPAPRPAFICVGWMRLTLSPVAFSLLIALVFIMPSKAIFNQDFRFEFPPRVAPIDQTAFLFRAYRPVPLDPKARYRRLPACTFHAHPFRVGDKFTPAAGQQRCYAADLRQFTPAQARTQKLNGGALRHWWSSIYENLCRSDFSPRFALCVKGSSPRTSAAPFNAPSKQANVTAVLSVACRESAEIGR